MVTTIHDATPEITDPTPDRLGSWRVTGRLDPVHSADMLQRNAEASKAEEVTFTYRGERYEGHAFCVEYHFNTRMAKFIGTGELKAVR